MEATIGRETTQSVYYMLVFSPIMIIIDVYIPLIQRKVVCRLRTSTFIPLIQQEVRAEVTTEVECEERGAVVEDRLSIP